MDTSRLSRKDILFLLALAEKGCVFMEYYSEKGHREARKHLEKIWKNLKAEVHDG